MQTVGVSKSLTRSARPIVGASSQPPRPSPEPVPISQVPKIAQLLVLGHYFERLVRDGVVRDYAEIARLAGLTRARVTQIVNLTLLAPELQERILFLERDEVKSTQGVERSLRIVVLETDWKKQEPRLLV